ncbi:CotO family spore coat protein [Jeotgalibacillus marinus]|uniref:CotO family spore coat protein n=1 Tax=Jeotgalibacillus marinus TaxID=86667 RepID=A0ABV3Q430_9BACL
MTKKDREKTSHNPLLYIEQPNFKRAKPSMQQVYQTSRKKEQEKEEKKKARKRDHINFEVEPLGYVEDEEKEMERSSANQAKSESNPVQKGGRFQEVKSFKEMDVNERLDYLIPFIGREAPFVCMFVFNDQSHVKGVLSHCEGDELTIQIKEGEPLLRKRGDLANIFIS